MDPSFPSSDTAYMLDLLGRRYGQRPSQILRFHPLDGRGLLLDMQIMGYAVDRENQPKSVKDKYLENKRGWDQESYKDIMKNVI